MDPSLASSKSTGSVCVPTSTITAACISISAQYRRLSGVDRRILDAGIKNKQDIYKLTTSLLMYDMRAKIEHWGRFAFLRQCTILYNKTPSGRRGDYWRYIDQCLKDMRENARKDHPTDVLAQKRHESLFLTHTLDNDIKMFPIRSGALARLVYSNDALTTLQRTTENQVSSFTVNDSPVATTPVVNSEDLQAVISVPVGAGAAE
ncbi:hypothetical protein C8Q73DRAFT_787811 [Cubamyces lactineus]|nr:hypothetical protein C8Q73DRAFT_787811 [Cubamyces lactineus]